MSPHPPIAGMPFAQACRALRDASGLGLGMMGCKRALLLSLEPGFGGDVLLAALYVDAGGLAVNVRGDRHAWNLSNARSRVERFRSDCRELEKTAPGG